MTKIKVVGWGDCVLHNRPFYSVVVMEDKRPVVKIKRAFKSYYELNKSRWTYPEFKVKE